MQKILALVALFVVSGWAFGQVGGYPLNPKFGNVAVTGSVTSTKACATGYTRVTPNFCRVTAFQLGYSALTRDACTTVAAPTGARAVLVGGQAVAKSANAVALRLAQVDSYPDSATCADARSSKIVAVSVREFSAVAAGTDLAQANAQGWAIVLNGNIYLQFTDDSGNQGTGSYSIYGYMD